MFYICNDSLILKLYLYINELFNLVPYKVKRLHDFVFHWFILGKPSPEILKKLVIDGHFCRK